MKTQEQLLAELDEFVFRLLKIEPHGLRDVWSTVYGLREGTRLLGITRDDVEESLGRLCKTGTVEHANGLYRPKGGE